MSISPYFVTAKDAAVSSLECELPDKADQHTSLSLVLDGLDLPSTLAERIHITRNTIVSAASTFVLYLPTVVLRSKHNPALAVACRLANYYKVPLVILCTVLDDAHLDWKYNDNIVATARRHAFCLQAIQAVDWPGATFVRVNHGSTTRRPHHLTITSQKDAPIVTVMDEPFVQPYSTYVCRVEQAARCACIRVDGSTTVPPRSILKKSTNVSGKLEGLPPRAFYWKQMTEHKRREHVLGAVKQGHFDAPELLVKCTASQVMNNIDHPLRSVLPRDWFEVDANGSMLSAPSIRAWTIEELKALDDPADWVNSADGIDQSVPVCRQSHGAHGWSRWQRFKISGDLARYGGNRNNITRPHTVSRLSCYLNWGTISIFQIVHELWQASLDTTKFEAEIIKWREMAYANAVAHPGHSYFEPCMLPAWSRDWLETKYRVNKNRNDNNSGHVYTLQQMALSQTNDELWNAMQEYLRETGELHNNARMTWAKTVVHWQAGHVDTLTLQKQLSYLNDRYALDGLSPPSYAGLGWCLGWSDKPTINGSISTRTTTRYKFSAQDFRQAQRVLMDESNVSPLRKEQQMMDRFLSSTSAPTTSPKPVSPLPSGGQRRKEPSTPTKRTKNDLTMYFSPTGKDNKRSKLS